MIYFEHMAVLREDLRGMAPVHSGYARLPVVEGFDWERGLRAMPDAGLYLVVFRSVRRVSADADLLKEHDDLAYAEAVGAGGLLHYFKGETNERRECLSFCVWENREHARKATGLPSHRAAAAIWVEMYESYELERYYLRRSSPQGNGDVVFERVGDYASAGTVAT